MNAGGSVRFTATDVIADITGSVSGTATQNTLNDINITWSTTQEEINSMASSWRGLILDFVKETNNVTLTININNKSSERAIDVTVTDNFNISNITTTRKVGENTVSSFSKVSISPNAIHSLSISMSVTDLAKSVDGTWSLALNLANQSVLDESVYQTLAFTYNDTNKTAEVKANSNNKPTGDIVIPAKVMHNGEAYEVTSIGTSVFYGCSFQSITIPESVTSIGNNAFSSCSNLTTVTFAEGIRLASIGEYAFYSCSLQSIIIPASVMSLGKSAFMNCNLLTRVVFEEGSKLERLNTETFRSCSLLSSINIPASVTYIDDFVFYPCPALRSAIFEDPNGWTADGKELSSDALSDPKTAATYLTSTYRKFVMQKA